MPIGIPVIFNLPCVSKLSGWVLFKAISYVQDIQELLALNCDQQDRIFSLYSYSFLETKPLGQLNGKKG